MANNKQIRIPVDLYKRMAEFILLMAPTMAGAKPMVEELLRLNKTVKRYHSG